MEWSKIKNIILIILLMANLLLLVLVAYRDARSARYLASARANAVGVLEQNGIHVDIETLPHDTSLPVLSMERDRNQEADAAAVLLGESSENGQGSSVLYTGEKGTLRFSRTGDFSADLQSASYPLGALSPEEHALQTLELLQFDGDVIWKNQDGDHTIVTVRQLWEGTPVFTCQAELVYEQSALVSIRTGASIRLTGTPTDTGTVQNMSVVTALVKFLEGITDLGDVCTELIDMTPGYTFSAGLYDPITLQPVWHIITDTGSYYLDVGTDVLRRAK